MRAEKVNLQHAIALAMHDARCGPAATHQPGRYFDCVKFFEDHADLALAAIEEAGYIVVPEALRPYTGARGDA